MKCISDTGQFISEFFVEISKKATSISELENVEDVKKGLIFKEA